MEFRYALCLPRDAGTVPLARHLCGASLRQLGAPPHLIADIELALTEACTNVLKHGGAANEYEISVEITADRCALRVSDTGSGFDHARLRAQEESATAEAGRGIQLMSALVDEVRFVSEADAGTAVHLVKHLTWPESSIMQRLVIAEQQEHRSGAHDGRTLESEARAG
jgi:serine/threonine-protein kinase RsbW